MKSKHDVGEPCLTPRVAFIMVPPISDSEAQCDNVFRAATLALSPGLLTEWLKPQTQSVAQNHVV
ncbi:hypothetical protein E2C01_095934 [Portunus trituberculatus]|uniref:Uncharacterized protein n=1 Tax=Portunus trituberculatus TaxID=210409 RepID=A0A5B7JUB3_PORTR|nr:hypothetical protein [Portunus trituberculatus]